MQPVQPASPWASLPLDDDDEPAGADAYVPVGVHLVGSVPLASAEQVFRLAARTLGDRLRRMPDGETGRRVGRTRQQRLRRGRPRGGLSRFRTS